MRLCECVMTQCEIKMTMFHWISLGVSLMPHHAHNDNTQSNNKKTNWMTIAETKPRKKTLTAKRKTQKSTYFPYVMLWAEHVTDDELKSILSYWSIPYNFRTKWHTNSSQKQNVYNLAHAKNEKKNFKQQSIQINSQNTNISYL